MLRLGTAGPLPCCPGQREKDRVLWAHQIHGRTLLGKRDPPGDCHHQANKSAGGANQLWSRRGPSVPDGGGSLQGLEAEVAASPHLPCPALTHADNLG